MLKLSQSLKFIEENAVEALKALLQQVPAVKLVGIEKQDIPLDRSNRFLGTHRDVRRGDIHWFAKLNLPASHATSGWPHLSCATTLHVTNRMLLVLSFIAPYLSSEAQTLCRKEALGFLDFEGNVRLLFDSVFIERLVTTKPVVERRELKSLFKPKSAQVLRVMLRDPYRAWRVTDLASRAEVSLGHVSNVRAALLDREWAQVSNAGLFLSEPDELLDAWRDAYEPPAGERMSFYTTLHGSAFEEAARQVLRSDRDTAQAAFASFSAAHWLAPYGRTGTQYFYADDAGVKQLHATLKLSSAAKGENVVVTWLKDPGLLRDTVEPAPGAICTSPIQTYLDLAAAGERGREAADHLRHEKLIWSK